VSARERTRELLADRALEGLSEREARELEALGAADDPSFDRAAAAAALAELAGAGDLRPLPAPLAERVLAGVPAASGATIATLPPRPSAATAPHRPRWDRGRALAWTLAAAAAVVAAFGWLRPPRVVERVQVVEREARPPRPPSAAEARAALLASAPDVTTRAWSSTKDPAASGASGDVVWSESRQEGYMRIRGLAANDPARAQYQLWIFDARREESHPVDGGVFDVGGDEVVIPIHAAVRVFEPKLFAVTVERPGGVVVSKRERIVLTAAR
jgi:hypothetical protein